MTQSRTDALLAALTAEVEARRLEIDAVSDLRRAELIFVFDERSGEPLDVVFRTEARRRLPQRHDYERGKLVQATRR